jgi:hypothetical protein
MTSYSKEECIEAIREANKKTEGKLSRKEYNKFRAGPLSCRFFSRDDFDGWNDAKKQAGLYVSKPGGEDGSKGN